MLNQIKMNLMKGKLEKENLAEQNRLEKLFSETPDKDIPATMKDLETNKGKVVRFPNGMCAFVGGDNEKDLQQGIDFVENLFASHKEHPMDIIVAQEHKEAGLIPDAEIEVDGERLLYYKETQNLRTLTGKEIVNLDDIPNAQMIPTEAALELLKRRAKEKLNNTEDEDCEDN